MLDLLFYNPLLFVVALLAIIVALSVHEFSHSLGAYLMGDRTSQYMGRLTLNPMAHIDPMGLLLLILVGFGWGKPVPFNIYNLRNNRWGQLVVAVFGPLSNFLLAGIALFVLFIFFKITSLDENNLLIQFLFRLIQMSFVLGVFNLIPIPPLDGSKALFSFFPQRFEPLMVFLETQGPFILLMLIVLDNFFGVHILSSFLSWSWFTATAWLF